MGEKVNISLTLEENLHGAPPNPKPALDIHLYAPLCLE